MVEGRTSSTAVTQKERVSYFYDGKLPLQGVRRCWYRGLWPSGCTNFTCDLLEVRGSLSP